MIFGNRIGKAVLLVAVEIAFFILFCAFMLTHQLGKTIAFIIFFIFLGVLFKKWGGLNDAMAKLFKEMKILAIGVFILMVLTLPFVFQTSPYLIHVCVMAGLYAILALGLNFQLGSTNVVNFATAASYGIGAYTSALLAVHFHVPFWIGIFLSGSAASLFGLVLGIPCMKTKDYYLSLVTIAFGLIIYILLINFSWTGGPNGIPNIPPPSILGHSFREPINLFGFNLPFQSNYFYLIFIFVIGALFVAYRLHHSRVGLTWNAIREDEIAARCQGIDVTWYKILAFCIDAFFGGVTGTVYAHYIGFISPENFAFIVSVVVVTMVILGGMDNVFGVIIGAVLLTILPEKFRAFEDFRLLIYGVIVVTMLIFRPQGLFPQKLRVYQK
jgi:ABC-type branched-subunit amino acid transport system permease subunit